MANAVHLRQNNYFFRFLRFGKADFWATAAVDISALLVILGLITFGWIAGVLAMKAVRKTRARSRAGRGVQKLISWVLGVSCYYVCVVGPIYATLNNPWLSGVVAVLLMQYPLYVVIAILSSAFQRRRFRSIESRNIFHNAQKYLFDMKNFIVWSWKYFFFPTALSYSDNDFASTEEVSQQEISSPGETRSFVSSPFKILDKNSSFFGVSGIEITNSYISNLKML